MAQVLPDPKNYVPPLVESEHFNRNQVDLSVNKLRQKLFKGKLFGFSSKTQLSKFAAAIGYAGGAAILVKWVTFEFRGHFWIRYDKHCPFLICFMVSPSL